MGQRITSRAREAGRLWLATLLLPTAAGLAVGFLGSALPLTLGDGSVQLQLVTQSVFNAQQAAADEGHLPNPFPVRMDDRSFGRDDLEAVTYTPEYLAKTVAADIFLLAVCQGFGFVGGQIFPSLFVGYLSGLIVYIKYNVAFDLAVPCMMVGVPCAFVPTPVTFVFLATTIFGLNGIGTTYVLISVIASFGANCGLGMSVLCTSTLCVSSLKVSTFTLCVRPKVSFKRSSRKRFVRSSTRDALRHRTGMQKLKEGELEEDRTKALRTRQVSLGLKPPTKTTTLT